MDNREIKCESGERQKAKHPRKPILKKGSERTRKQLTMNEGNKKNDERKQQ